MSKKITIIGGGIGGLAAGCYCKMNGYDTTVLEKNGQCGGVTAVWERGGYVFDGGTNWVVGSKPGEPEVYSMFGELIDFTGWEIKDINVFIRIEEKGGVLTVYSDMDRLREEMIRIAPEDEKTIRLFTESVKKLSRLNIPFQKTPALMSLPELAVFPFVNIKMLLTYLKWNRVSIDKFSERFKNGKLRSMFRHIFTRHESHSILSPMMTLAWLHKNGTGYPMGGSAGLVKRLEDRFTELGGNLLLNRDVKRINIENGSVKGVSCRNGENIDSDIVISAADARHTFYDLIGEEYIDETIKKYFDEEVFPSIIQISLGIKKDFRGEPSKLILPLGKPLETGNETAENILLRICNFDSCYSPEGKTAVVAHLRTYDYAYWTELRKSNREKYVKEKKRIASAVIDSLEKRFGNVRENIEYVDVATPATYIRYTNVWKGSYQSWAPVPGKIGKTIKRELSCIDGFYLAGQWVAIPGGIPRAISLGRQTAQMICKKDKIKFRTE